jgi:hypothetical protein
MSLIFIDGCMHTGEGYSPSRKYSEQSGCMWRKDTYGPPDPLSRIPGRWYKRCDSNNVFAHDLYFAEKDELIVGFAWWMPGSFDGEGFPTLFGNYDGWQCSFFLTSDGAIEVYRGAGTTLLGSSATNVMPSGEWQFIEMRAKVHQTQGEMEVRISGEVVVHVSGEDTQLQSSSGITRWQFNNPENTNDVGMGLYEFMEDFYILDTLGEHCNDFLGDIRIDTLKVNLAGNYAEWVPSGEATCYECVDEDTIDLDSTYIKSHYSGEKVSFQFHSLDDHLDQLGLPIKAISMIVPQRKDDWGEILLKPFYRKDGADYTSGELKCIPYPQNITKVQTGQVPQASYFFDDYFMSNYIEGVLSYTDYGPGLVEGSRTFIWHENVKDGGVWSESDLVSGEFGIELSKSG